MSDFYVFIFIVELAEERPASKASSTKSAGSAKEAPVNGAPSEPTDAGTEKKSASRQSSKQSSRGKLFLPFTTYLLTWCEGSHELL